MVHQPRTHLGHTAANLGMRKMRQQTHSRQAKKNLSKTPRKQFQKTLSCTSHGLTESRLNVKNAAEPCAEKTSCWTLGITAALPHTPASLTRKCEKFVPTDFLTEGIDQTRGWANSLLLEYVVLTGEPDRTIQVISVSRFNAGRKRQKNEQKLRQRGRNQQAVGEELS